MIRKIGIFIMALLLTPAALAGEVQIPLTVPIIEGLIAAQSDLKKIPPATENEDGKAILLLLEQIASRHGFRSFDDMDNAAYSVGVALTRLDAHGNYVSVKDFYEAAIAEAKADRTLPESERNDIIAAFIEAMNDTPEVQYMQNIELVRQYRERIFKAL